ncbi:hypothetical protein [Simiduia agarivorans]|uniref:MSHA biogenesis protein MshK n=1 Tax=Simiduia agarivorans (strain DSM 21679 / JCM 13881 / BCRC 17597 / SA1) TaxID=1117647 RepID=K4KG44_SIMAS|nr:hypothetical protein [Simiduia agarivorans]AFU98059.1 hypothetical protein M5M_04260 [Simiduia agarivorans SA1 = DSM 21679]
MNNAVLVFGVLMLAGAESLAETALSDPTRPLNFAASPQVKQFALTSIFRKPAGSAAIINGRLISVGQTVDGVELISVGESSATIKTDSGIRTLTMHRAVKR